VFEGVIIIMEGIVIMGISDVIIKDDMVISVTYCFDDHNCELN
jgi:hypothetical protein